MNRQIELPGMGLLKRARFMGGGGGDGGNAAAEAEAAAKRDRERRAAAVRKLMQYFGEAGGEATALEKPVAPAIPVVGGRKAILTPAEFAQLPAPARSGYARVGNEYRLSSAGTSQPTPSQIWSGQRGQAGTPPLAGYDAALRKFQEELAAYNAALAEQRAAGGNAARYKALEDRIARNVTNFQTRELDEQLDQTAIRLKDELARRGHIGGSQQVDQEAELRRLNDDALLDIANQANQARLNFRNDKSRALSNAVAQINADVDASTAINQALSQTNLAAQQAEETAKGQNLGDVFARLSYLYGLQQQGAGRRAAEQQYGQRFGASSVGTGSSYSGNIVRY